MGATTNSGVSIGVTTGGTATAASAAGEFLNDGNVVSVTAFADLPSAATYSGKLAWVRESSGVIFVNRKISGWYRSNGSTWEAAQVSTDEDTYIATDATGRIYTSAATVEGALDDLDAALDRLSSASFGITIDGGGSAITTGVKGYVEIPQDMAITGWTLLGDTTGSIVIDVWKDTYANYPPTVADTIAGSEKPTISSSTKGQDLSLSTWTTTVAAGDVVGFNVDSCSTITRATLIVRGNKT